MPNMHYLKMAKESLYLGKFLYSIKTFIPEQVFTNNVSGLRPYNWTYSDLESAGYVK